MASQPHLPDAGSVSVPYESLKRVTRERKSVVGHAMGRQPAGRPRVVSLLAVVTQPPPTPALPPALHLRTGT